MSMIFTIKVRLLGFVSASVIAMVVLGWVGYVYTDDINSYVEELGGQVVPSLIEVAQMNEATTDMQWQTQRVMHGLISNDPELLRRARVSFAEAEKRFDDARKEYEKIPQEPEEVPVWKAVQDEHRNWRAALATVWQYTEVARDHDKAIRYWRDEALPIVVDFHKQMDALVVLSEDIGKRKLAEARAVDARANSIILGVGLWSTLAAFGFGTYLLLSITRPLQKMQKVAQALAKGDVEQRVDHESRDELGALAESFRASVGYMQELAAAAAAIGKGDLSVKITPKSPQDAASKSLAATNEALEGVVKETQRLIAGAQAGDLSVRGDGAAFSGAYAELIRGINRMLESMAPPMTEAVRVLERVAARDLTVRMAGDYQGEFAKMKGSLNTAVENLHESMGAVASAADQVASAASQIASTSQAVAQGASEQARSLEETSSSLEEMSSMTKQNAQSANQANELAATARQASDQGGAAMEKMVQAMDQIRGSAEGTAAIIKDINEIAFQTNLLALNAAVEAARAGAAGRGFAVVAEEVRNLALRSKEAAKKTESLINDSVQLSRQGEGISRQVSSNLGEIVGSVNQVSEIIRNIATASGEQSRGVDQISKSVAQMDQVTQQNAASSEESSSAAEELSGQAQEMTSLVAQFKLDRQTRIVSPKVPASRNLMRPQVAAPRAARTNGTNGHANGHTHGHANGHAAALTIPFDSDVALKDF